MSRVEDRKGRYPGLDGLRGVSAVLVLVTHLSNANMHILPGINLAGMGRMALWLFFVLSAFLLTEQAIKAAAKPPVSFAKWTSEYIFRRFFRIYPVLICALILDLFWSRITGKKILDVLLLYSGPGIYWTIAPEFQYYFLIPLVGWILTRFKVLGMALIGLFAVSTMGISTGLPWLSICQTPDRLMSPSEAALPKQSLSRCKRRFPRRCAP